MIDEITPWHRVRTNLKGNNSSYGQEDKLEWIEVPGGRLYRTWIAHRSGCSVALTFVPVSEGKS